MSFFDFLDKVRKKPEAERYKIAILLTAVIMVFVVAVWFAFLVNSKETKESVKKNSPFSVISSMIKELRN